MNRENLINRIVSATDPNLRPWLEDLDADNLILAGEEFGVLDSREATDLGNEQWRENAGLDNDRRATVDKIKKLGSTGVESEAAVGQAINELNAEGRDLEKRGVIAANRHRIDFSSGEDMSDLAPQAARDRWNAEHGADPSPSEKMRANATDDDSPASLAPSKPWMDREPSDGRSPPPTHNGRSDREVSDPDLDTDADDVDFESLSPSAIREARDDGES